MGSVRATDFGRKYIWPNAVLPSPTALITAAYKAASGRLTLETVEDVSLFHYSGGVIMTDVLRVLL